MKGCLKLRYPLQNAAGGKCVHRRKCVAFCAEGSEEVHLADEWDRTPTEPARCLTYQDVLELREIQQSLPTAKQSQDGPFFRLHNIPIQLLPLLPKSDSSLQSSSPLPSPPLTVPPPSTSSPFPGLLKSVPPTPTYHPSHLAHLPNSIPTQRPRPNFNFLPLVDTPPSTPSSSQPPSPPSQPSYEATDPPTESSDDSPNSPQSSLPSAPKPLSNPYFPPYPPNTQTTIDTRIAHQVQATRLRALPSPTLIPPSPLSLYATVPPPKNIKV